MRSKPKACKKYPSLKKELLVLVQDLKENPVRGISIGKNYFKIRIAVASKGKGKVVAEELSATLLSEKILFSYFLFITNLKKKTLQKKNWKHFYNPFPSKEGCSKRGNIGDFYFSIFKKSN